MLQSKLEEITVQELSEVDDWITEHITHIIRALTTEGFGKTTDTSSTEGFGDPTSTEKYIESSFEENLHSEFEFLAHCLVVGPGPPPPPVAHLS